MTFPFRVSARFALLATLVLPTAFGPANSGWAAPAKPAPAAPSAALPIMPEAQMPRLSRDYSAFALRRADAVQKNMPELSRVGEIMAKRHLAGGAFTWSWNSQGLQQELFGRSGNFVNFGPDRVWKKDRSPEEKANDVILTGWERDPGGGELAGLKAAKAAGAYLVSFGPRDAPALKDLVALSDVWFDTGLGTDDRVVALPDGTRAGRGNFVANSLNGWALMAETVAALTRAGKMPTMWKSYSYPDGRAWGDKYLFKQQFHDEFTVPPVKAGVLGKAFLDEIRANFHSFETKQGAHVSQAVREIVAESKAGRKTVVASMGHAPWTYVGFYEDAKWGFNADLHDNNDDQINRYNANTPEGALVLRLGYSGMSQKEHDIFAAKKQRVLLISTPNPNEDAKIPADIPLLIDMEWAYGDATVSLEGYPIKLFPPSGIMQDVAYESVNVAVLGQLAGK